MEKLLVKLENINFKQKELTYTLKTETFDEVHSILRTKQLCEKFLELELEKNLLIEIIIKINN